MINMLKRFLRRTLLAFTLTWLLLASAPVHSQSLYYPPLAGPSWDTVNPQTLGWCTAYIDTLYDFLDNNNTKAFIVLKDGKIALEKYFGSFTKDSSWYWASAGKSLVAFLAGQTQEQGLLHIDSSTSTYLGNGWTNCTAAQEQAITVRHQLSMTSGLDDSQNNDCTAPACLNYFAPPGTRWAYHNGAYTLIQSVIEQASGKAINNVVFQNLTVKTGLAGLFVPVGDLSIFFSRPRHMARFGLLMLGQGQWNGNTVLADTAYLQDMITPSQSINPSYGYLWWLNGQPSFMLPQLQFTFPGPLLPAAPADLYAAIGKNGQIINVVPSQGLVVVRMGNAPGSSLVPNAFNDSLWLKLNQVICTGMDLQETEFMSPIQLHDHNGTLEVLWAGETFQASIYNMSGQVLLSTPVQHAAMNIPTAALVPGVHILVLTNSEGKVVRKKVVINR